jgi:protein-disulfide isomerase
VRPLSVALALAALLGPPACSRSASAPPPAPTAPLPPGGSATPAPAQEDPLGTLAAGLSAPARRELATVLSDEFCHCGCPHTLGTCLASHDCVHARRSARLAAGLAAGGLPASEIIVALARYAEGFRTPRARLQPDARMCTGRADAPVTLVEFSDFECPYCAAARPLLEAFAGAHPEQVRFCSLPFPLASHPNALPAGQAVLFARDQGRFWPLHDALFEHQHDLGPAALSALAGQVGLEAAALQKALAAGTYRAELEAFRQQGLEAGVDGTPTLFFNGRRYVLPLGEQGLAHALEDELEWQANGGAWAKD